MISTKDLFLVPLTFVNNLSWWPDIAVNVMNSHPLCEYYENRTELSNKVIFDLFGGTFHLISI